ncbi:MAG: hypothetical protein DHS20C14_01080 [Phycisphaeraceae bacterium]|nr:MAG: hypothetical protein DHS20C14_01080 [Phycisphaeraceae bacterium]
MDFGTPDLTSVLGASTTPSVRPPAGLGVIRGDESQRSFRDVLGMARSRTPELGADASPEARAANAEARAAESRDAAEQFVAKTFIEPVLSSVRENSQAAPPFAPTQAEQQFRAMADARLAIDVVKRANLPIVDRLARDLLA